MDSIVEASTPAIMPSTDDTLTVGKPHCPVKELIDEEMLVTDSKKFLSILYDAKKKKKKEYVKESFTLAC